MCNGENELHQVREAAAAQRTRDAAVAAAAEAEANSSAIEAQRAVRDAELLREAVKESDELAARRSETYWREAVATRGADVEQQMRRHMATTEVWWVAFGQETCGTRRAQRPL